MSRRKVLTTKEALDIIFNDDTDEYDSSESDNEDWDENLNQNDVEDYSKDDGTENKNVVSPVYG